MKKQALALIIIAISLPSLAENNALLKNFSTEYLIGSTSQESIMTSDDSNLIIDGSEVSVGFRAAYQITDYFAAELSYNSWGSTVERYIYNASAPDEEPEYERSNTKFATDSINLGVKATLPLKHGFSFNGRVGMAKWDFESEGIDSLESDSVYSFDDNGYDAYAGVGLQYEINPNAFIALEYSVMKFDVTGNKITTTIEVDVEQIQTSTLTADQEIKNISLSLGFRF